MGLFSKAKKTVKKVLKSDLGKLAAAWATYQYAPGMWGGDPGAAGWKTGWEKFAPWLMGGTESQELVGGRMVQKTTQVYGVEWVP